MIGLIAKLAINVVSKLLPTKPKKIIQDLVNSVVVDDKEIQEGLEAHRRFILEHEGRAEHLAPFVASVRALVRPIIALSFTFVFLRHFWVFGTPPDTLITAATLGIVGWYFGERLIVDKLKKR